ncbi:MAG: vWA domain-containing protein [Sphingomonas sp.]
MANPVIVPDVWDAFGPYTVTGSNFVAIDIRLAQLDDTAAEITLTIPAAGGVSVTRSPVGWATVGTAILTAGVWVAAPVALGDWTLTVSPGGAATDPATLTIASNVSSAAGILRIVVTGIGVQPASIEGAAGTLSIDRVLAAPQLQSVGVISAVPVRERKSVMLSAAPSHSVVQNPAPATPLGAAPAILAKWSENPANTIALSDFNSPGATASFTAPGIYEPETLGFTIAATLDLDAGGTAGVGEPVTTQNLNVPIETAVYRLALVLDRSGSMGETLGGGLDKWTAAVRAAHAWTDMFRAFRPQATHQVGVITFESGTGGFGVQPLPAEITFRNPSNGAVAAGLAPLGGFGSVNNWNLGSPQTSTPIGDALVEAWQGIGAGAGPDDVGAVILLTDGYENAGLVSLASPAPVGATTFTTRRTQPDLATANQQIGANVYTLGVGTTVDEDVLNMLGSNSYRLITGTTLEIQPALIEMLGHIVDAQPLQVLPPPGGPDGRLYYEQSTNERVLAFLVQWENITDNLLLARSDQGANVFAAVNPGDPGVSITKRGTHGLIRVDLRAHFAPNPPPAGDWRLEHVDNGGTRIPLVANKVAAMVDLYTKVEIGFDKRQYFIGEPIGLTCRIRAGGARVSDAKVTLEAARPGEGLGTFLTIYARRYQPPKPGKGDQLVGKGLMYQTLLKLTDRDSLPIVSVPPFELYDDGVHDDGAAGDGDFANVYADTAKEGTYTFRFRAEGKLPDGSRFSRIFVRSTWVGVKPDPGLLGVVWASAGTVDNLVLSTATMTPRAKNGEYLGPFRTAAIALTVHGGTLDGPLIDHHDGSYSQRVLHAPGVDPILVPTIYDTPMVPSGPAIDPPATKRDCCRLWHRAFRCTIDGILRFFGLKK